MQLDKLSTDPAYLTALLQRTHAELSQAIAQKLALDVTAGIVAADNARLMAEVADLNKKLGTANEYVSVLESKFSEPTK